MAKRQVKSRPGSSKLPKERQRVLKQSGVPVTAAVKAELMKAAMVKDRKATKKSMVNGKIELTPGEFTTMQDTFFTAG